QREKGAARGRFQQLVADVHAAAQERQARLVPHASAASTGAIPISLRRRRAVDDGPEQSVCRSEPVRRVEQHRRGRLNMSDAQPNKPKGPLSEISHLFLSSVRERQTNGAPRPVRKPPAPPAVPATPSDSIDDLTPEEYA